MDALWQDLRYAIRQLRGSIGFTLAAVATMAIGIGTTTAIFSMVNAALLRPLPYPHADELVTVRTRMTDGRLTNGLLAPVEITRLNDPKLSISRLSAISQQPFDATLIRPDGTPVNVLMSGVGEGFFDLVGLPMVAGSAFTHEDFVMAGQRAPIRVVLSYAVWTEMFGRDPGIVGKPLRFAEFQVSATVAGVASAALDLPHGCDLWFNLPMFPQDVGHAFDGLLRMRPGTSLARLRSEMSVVMAGLAKDVPADVNRDFVVRPLVASMVGDLGPTLLIIFAATVLLLVLACVNVATLLLARGAVRTREAAVRAALGATRLRIVRQLVTESMVIAASGAVAGIAVAYVAVKLLLALGASKLPRLDRVPFDVRVLAFAVAALLFSGLAMGLPPAWRLARTDIRALLDESGRSASTGRGTSRLMGWMIVGEIALAITLVAGAGWLVQSFSRLRATDPGFTTAGRLVVNVRPTRGFQKPEEAQAWSDEMLRHVGSATGVRLVGSAVTYPFRADRDTTMTFAFEGEQPNPDRMRSGRLRIVTPGFFEAMGIKLLGGRDFTSDDRRDTMPVAIVNETFVRQHLGGRRPLNVQFAYGYPKIDPKTMRTIVGVVDDVRYLSLGVEPEPIFYVTQRQMQYPFTREEVVAVSRTMDPNAIVSSVRSELKAFDSHMVADFAPASQIVAATLDRQALGTTLMAIFGAVALTLAGIGIYGVIAYGSAQRRTEIATRAALGATPRDLRRLLMTQGERLAVAGTVLGVGAAYTGGRIAAANVYEMRASDPLILTAATIVVALVALAATAVPAIRASRTDAVGALRRDP